MKMMIIPDIVAIHNSGGQFIIIHYDPNCIHYGLMSWTDGLDETSILRFQLRWRWGVGGVHNNISMA